MLSFIKGLFGMDRVVDSGMKIIDRLAGTDFTPQQQADFILKYQEATKHQSVARRFIAISITIFWLLCGLLWVASTGASDVFALEGAANFAASLSKFMQDNLATPVNIVIGFYFATHMLKR